MNRPSESLEQIAATLDALRQNPMTRRRFPQAFWDSVLQLAKKYPLNEICRRLRLDPAYLRSKIHRHQEANFDFRELSFSSDPSSAVLIELTCERFTAKIHGPASCIEQLSALFKE